MRADGVDCLCGWHIEIVGLLGESSDYFCDELLTGAHIQNRDVAPAPS